MKKTCTIENCTKQHVAKGLCRNHYAIMRRNGSPVIRQRVSPNELLKFIHLTCHKKTENCIEAPFGIKQNGYAAFWKNGKKIHAHREVCTIAHGKPPSEKHHAAHICGNKKCLNSKHLRWATPFENQKDKIIHGTQYFGTDVHNAKLKNEDVLKIRNLRGKLSQAKIAERFKISQSYVSEIQLKKTWEWLKDEK
jgi:hypothetical protein